MARARFCQKRRDAFLALGGFQRAGAIKEGAADAKLGGGVAQETVLDVGEVAGVVGALEVEDIRVAADRAGRGARRVDQDVVEHDAAAPCRCVAGNCPGLEL